MSEVHQRPRGGKGGDPFAARRALRRFIKAAVALDAAWHPLLEVPTYPRYLPAFETLLRDLKEWQEEAEDRPWVEPKESQPVDLGDPEAVRAWVADLRTQIGDATDVGEDALRPLGRRRLGRPIARRTLREAKVAIDQLLTAAERGAGNPA